MHHRKDQPHRIGVLIGDVSFEFSLELMRGMSDSATNAGVHVMFFLGMQKHGTLQERLDGREASVSHNSVYDYAALAGVDSFIFACGSLTGFSGDGLYQQFLQRYGHKPYVVLQERVALDTPTRTFIVIDNYQSFTQCMEHLIVDHGYRRIGYVSGPRGHSDAKQRLRAYMDAMERHHLAVEPSRIVYGSFYEYEDEQVANLLDQHPDLEAIAFANDEMAKAGYRECSRRGLVIGRDIAITGFDNFSFCHTMEPPLTTVAQSAYRMGELAIQYAVRLTNGETVPPLVMPTEFIRRQSCGCSHNHFCYAPDLLGMESASFIKYAIESIVDSYVMQFSSDEREHNAQKLTACLESVQTLALEAPEETLDFGLLQRTLNSFVQSAPMMIAPLTHSLEDYLLRVLCANHLPPAVRRFSTAVTYMQQYFHTAEMHAMETRLYHQEAESWIAPELTRGLYGQDSEEEVYRCITERLAMAGLKHIYICLLEEPQRYASHGLETVPSRLYLAARGHDGKIQSYPQGQMPVIDDANPFCDMHDFSVAPSMMAFSFFSGENQYGILICETDGGKSALLHVIGLQLGMLIDFLALRRKEQKVASELEDIREKNEILNFLSEYDELCGLPNRRGFIASAIRLNRENIGKTAFCAFIDLDYLKQINDTFGHSEGDCALQAVSTILQSCVTQGDLLGRIGGDEFVGLFIHENSHYGAAFAKKLRLACDVYNDSVQKPYLLDISIGITSFTCTQGLEISGIVAEADHYLYAAKRKRTHTALRLRGGNAGTNGA